MLPFYWLRGRVFLCSIYFLHLATFFLPAARLLGTWLMWSAKCLCNRLHNFARERCVLRSFFFLFSTLTCCVWRVNKRFGHSGMIRRGDHNTKRSLIYFFDCSIILVDDGTLARIEWRLTRMHRRWNRMVLIRPRLLPVETRNHILRETTTDDRKQRREAMMIYDSC